VSLSIKALKEDPWKHAADKYKKDQLVDAVIIKYNKHGALVSLEEGVAGLVHISEFKTEEELRQKFLQLGHPEVTVFGEAYGGKLMHMSATYGKELRFVAFEVKIGPCWLSVPQAHEVATLLGLDFVHYKLVTTTLEALDAEKEAPSVQAVKCGMGEGHKREGIVLRPPIELTRNNGERVICKYKRKDFEETATPREVSAERLKVLSDAEEIANEWVTMMRLSHVLGGFPEAKISDMGALIHATLEDVIREGAGEIVVSNEVKRAICVRAGKMLKQLFLQPREA
jgi:hypothetical protein